MSNLPATGQRVVSDLSQNVDGLSRTWTDTCGRSRGSCLRPVRAGAGSVIRPRREVPPRPEPASPDEILMPEVRPHPDSVETTKALGAPGRCREVVGDEPGWQYIVNRYQEEMALRAGGRSCLLDVAWDVRVHEPALHDLGEVGR